MFLKWYLSLKWDTERVLDWIYRHTFGETQKPDPRPRSEHEITEIESQMLNDPGPTAF